MAEQVSEARYRELYPERVRKYDITTDHFVDATAGDWNILIHHCLDKGTPPPQGRTQKDWDEAELAMIKVARARNPGRPAVTRNNNSTNWMD